jgi:hypothetical protein
MADLFKETVPSILNTNEYMIRDEIDEKEYDPYIVNKALSKHIDCVLHVNNMNILNTLDKKMQYDYYFHSIRKMKRKFQPWEKKNNIKYLENVKRFFNYSTRKAEEMMKILTEEQLQHIVNCTQVQGNKC